MKTCLCGSLFDITQEDTDKGVVAQYVCMGCGNRESIPNGEILYYQSLGNNAGMIDDSIKYAAHDHRLALTKQYTCPNDKCETQKHPERRLAAITRNVSHQVVYICKLCDAKWVTSHH